MPMWLCQHNISQSSVLLRRLLAIARNRGDPSVIAVHYDNQSDILTFVFTETPQTAVAEAAADEVWVRFDPDARRVCSVDVLNFSARVRAAFGLTLIYTERTDSQCIESIHRVSLPPQDEEPV
jgi:uncharacterized protein YuzE